jgi:hypothetical protein
MNEDKKQRACVVLTDNDESIEINDFFYAALNEAGDEISIAELAEKARKHFPSNPLRERLIDESDFLDFDAMKSTGLVPVVHYYPVTDGKVTTAGRHFYSRRDMEVRMRAFGMKPAWLD